MAKISKCVNCNIVPEIVRSADIGYPYLLRHKLSVTCYPNYKLETYQRTEKECIDIWNNFNTR